jgi:putative photosynthetic complex assembly protein
MSSTWHFPDEHEPVLPRWALLGAGGVILATIVVAAIGGNPITMPPSQPTIARSLIFTDAPDGAVLVTDAATHAGVARLAPGSNGFIRATLRTLAHAGSHETAPVANHPFLITAWRDGRLTLDDPVSGRRLDLEAFGSLNSGAFAALLTAKETP